MQYESRVESESGVQLESGVKSYDDADDDVNGDYAFSGSLVYALTM